MILGDFGLYNIPKALKILQTYLPNNVSAHSIHRTIKQIGNANVNIGDFDSCVKIANNISETRRTNPLYIEFLQNAEFINLKATVATADQYLHFLTAQQILIYLNKLNLCINFHFTLKDSIGCYLRKVREIHVLNSFKKFYLSVVGHDSSRIRI